MENQTNNGINEHELCTIVLPGMKFEFANPRAKTIIILLILLMFFVVLVVLLKGYIIPGIAALGGRKIFSSIVSKNRLL